MIKNIKLDKGWKLLIYFDIIVPAFIFLLALITNTPFLAKLFHSYEMFIVNPIPNLTALTGIIGLIYHLVLPGYTLFKRDYKDLALCLLIIILITLFFLFEINYFILKPLSFS